ncbi:MAG: hypothetical protein JSU72_13095 [Deltaproteobacteria bacterium]|nr:MAG: hypothetical protein JSU72_13095 [Deltaproteobacteria bacterium]
MGWEDFKLTSTELDFLIKTAAPEVEDRSGLRQLLESDKDFRNAFIGDEKTFQRVADDREVFLKISPRLYFEILLRKAGKELESASHTLERVGTQRIAVFDTREVVDLLSKHVVMVYLADMLASFTKVESYTISYRVKEGNWRKIRFSDLDIDSLIIFSEAVDDEYRLGLFKRIADICLFLLGVFPEYVRLTHRYPFSGELRPQMASWMTRSPEDYEEEGKRFYQLAAEHPVAKTAELSEVFTLLHENFHAAKRPLNFLSEHYFHREKSFVWGGDCLIRSVGARTTAPVAAIFP